MRWVIETQRIGSFMHVPIALGGRLFGVLSATHEVRGRFGEADLARLAAPGVGAAGAIAHGLEFEHERRIARALTRGFVPGPPDPQTGLELRLVYEPVAHQVGGGDVFGVWTLPSGAVAVLIGDVSGKGLEVAAASAMVRFFVEARAWDTEPPADVLAQANRILRCACAAAASPLPSSPWSPTAGCATATRATAAVPAACRRRRPSRCEGSGLPLGIEEDGRHEEREVEIGLGDVLFAATDGLLETRREGAFFGDARLPGLLSEFGRTSPAGWPSASSPRRRSGRRCSTTTSSCSRCGARRSSSCATSPRAARPRRRSTGSTWGSCASGSGPGFEPEESIFATERVFEEERAGFVVLYARGRAVGCGGVRSLGPELAEIKRMFVTADARGHGHGRRLLAELERRAAAAGATRVRLLTTEVLAEAMALYESAGYTVVEIPRARGPARHLARAPPGGLGPPRFGCHHSRTHAFPRRAARPAVAVAWHEHDRASHPASGPRGRAVRRPGVGGSPTCRPTATNCRTRSTSRAPPTPRPRSTEIASLRSRLVGPAGWVCLLPQTH